MGCWKHAEGLNLFGSMGHMILYVIITYYYGEFPDLDFHVFPPGYYFD